MEVWSHIGGILPCFTPIRHFFQLSQFSLSLCTCDFLRHSQSIDNLPPNSVLVTIDVTGLYTHIPRDEGIKATREALDRRKDKSVPTHFIVKLLELLEVEHL